MDVYIHLFLLWHHTGLSDQLHTLATLFPQKDLLVSIAQEDGSAPDVVWMLWRTDKSLDPAGNQTTILWLYSL
jgi:hypothetical protein